MCHCYWHGDDKRAIAIDRVDDAVEKHVTSATSVNAHTMRNALGICSPTRAMLLSAQNAGIPLTRSYTAELLNSDFPLLGNNALFPFGCWTRQYSLSPVQGRSLTAVLTIPPKGGYVAILKDPIKFAIRCYDSRVCCLLVLNLVSSTLPCIRRPRPRLALANLHVGRYLDLD